MCVFLCETNASFKLNFRLQTSHENAFVPKTQKSQIVQSNITFLNYNLVFYAHENLELLCFIGVILYRVVKK